MNLATVLQILTATIGLIGAVTPIILNFSRSNRSRENLHKLLEVSSGIQENSNLANQISELVQYEIDNIRLDDRKEISPLGIGIGVSFIIISVFVTVISIQWDSNWKILTLIVSFIMFILGVAGISQDSQRKIRKEDPKN